MQFPRAAIAIAILISSIVLPCKSKFHETALAETNKLRAKHGAPPLTRDPKMDKYAQAYADKLAVSDKFEHNPEGKYGENLGGYWGPKKSDKDAAIDAIQSWYDEIKDYDFDKPDFTMESGHFTQLVWKASKRLGIGVATNPKTRYTVIVANYDPPGNMMGDFAKNVGRPK